MLTFRILYTCIRQVQGCDQDQGSKGGVGDVAPPPSLPTPSTATRLFPPPNTASFLSLAYFYVPFLSCPPSFTVTFAVTGRCRTAS